MSRWKLWFVLLLLLPFCTDNTGTEELLVKTISEETDVTRICRNDTMNTVLIVVCKIHTQRSRGEVCRLMYRHGQDFVHECDSRFTLMNENQTVFLHLINLTPEDSGNYTCECVYNGGTYRLHLNVTVEEGDKVSTSSSAEMPFLFAVIGVPVLIIIGLIYIKKRLSRRHQGPITSVESTALYTQAEQTEQNDVFIQKENVIYGL